jgi:hypothetical protein
MRIETKDYAFDLPDGFVEQPADTCRSFVHAEDHRELTVATMIAKEEAGVDDMLRRLADARLAVLRENQAAELSLPVAFADRNDLRIASFVSVGKEPLVSFCASITHARALMGQRYVVSLCMYQYFKHGAGAPVVDEFERFARSVAETVEPLPQRHALLRGEARGDAVDATRLYPYLVPAGYLETRPPAAPPPRALGHGLHLALAEDFDGAARIRFAEDIPSLGAPEALVALAASNLARAAAERKVTIQGFAGPRGLPVMIFGPEWLAAGCLLLPDLHAFAGAHLGDGPLCASVPHRDAMLVFKQEDASYRKEMQDLIAKNEAGARKPLTAGLFTVTHEGVTALEA